MRKPDWTIHAVFDDTGTYDLHTHGLEKYGLQNICMECPSKNLVQYCGGLINQLAFSMIDGEKYSINKTQYLDNADDYNEVRDVFDLEEEERDNGAGLEKVLVIYYWFDDIFINPYNDMPYTFDEKKQKWVCVDPKEYGIFFAKDEE